MIKIIDYNDCGDCNWYRFEGFFPFSSFHLWIYYNYKINIDYGQGKMDSEREKCVERWKKPEIIHDFQCNEIVE